VFSIPPPAMAPSGMPRMYGTCAASYAAGLSRNTTAAWAVLRLTCFDSSLARAAGQGTDDECSPRRQTQFGPSFHEFYDIL
jgi:hypothetical protein